jgi:hypothetical protein
MAWPTFERIHGHVTGNVDDVVIESHLAFALEEDIYLFEL